MNISEASFREPQVLPISAPTPEALETATNDLLCKLKMKPAVDLPEAACTLQAKQPADPIRRILICTDTEEAVAMLERQEDVPRRIYTNKKGLHAGSPIVFMFPGQGAQYVEMGRDLYTREPVFREYFDSCMDIVKSVLGIDLKKTIFPDQQQLEAMTEQLKQTATTQPALFSIEYALAQLWISKGIRPDAMIGHSIGEYTAACIAGVFSLNDALELVCQRSRLMQQISTGSMASFRVSPTLVETLLDNVDVGIATLNAPNACVISGAPAAVKKVLQKADQQNILYQVLRTSHAFHSSMMNPAKEALLEYTKKITMHAPETPFISNLTGTWFTEDDASNPAYWGEHLRNAVRFSEGMEQLMNHAPYIFIEVGPGNSLCMLARQHMDNPSITRTIATLRHPKEKQSDYVFFKTAFGRCWLAGIRVNWPSLQTGAKHCGTIYSKKKIKGTNGTLRS